MALKIGGSAGRFGVRYGTLVRRRIADIEKKQKQKQSCIFCNGWAKRVSKGIWVCKKCGKKFAGHAYFLDKQELIKTSESEQKPESKEKAKVLKNEKPANTIEKPKKARKSKTKSETKTE